MTKLNLMKNKKAVSYLFMMVLVVASMVVFMALFPVMTSFTDTVVNDTTRSPVERLAFALTPMVVFFGLLFAAFRTAS